MLATVSIIIPVYNKESAVSSCLDSIIAQTFRDFECILVDDGSTDNSGAICDEYAKKDPRFKPIHKKNGGVSSARNTGIQAAQGPFLIFCDSDDTIPPNALERLLFPLSSFEGDMVVGDFDMVSIDPDKNIVRREKSYQRAYCEAEIANTTALYEFFCNNNMLSSCGKLYRRQIISDHQLRFDTNLIVLEDYAFVLDYLAHCQKICMIPEVVYHYISLTTSSVTQRRARKDFLFDVLRVSDKLTEFLSSFSLNDSDEFHKRSIYPTLRLAFDIIWMTETPDINTRIKKYKRIKQALKDDTFKKMLKLYKNTFSRSEYICLRLHSVYSLVFVNLLKKIFKH